MDVQPAPEHRFSRYRLNCVNDFSVYIILNFQQTKKYVYVEIFFDYDIGLFGNEGLFTFCKWHLRHHFTGL